MTGLARVQFIRQHRLFIFLALFIISLYFFLRFYQLTTFPLFIDEVSYLRWGILIHADASQRFVSLTDGKQPLFVWLLWPSMKIFSDPIFAGRIVSVMTGLASLLGLFILSLLLFRKIAIGLLSSFLYVILPMTIVYDRLTLYDSLVSALTVGSLIGIVLLVRFVRMDVAILLGYVLGLGLLTKSSMQLILFMSPLGLLLAKKLKKRNVLKLCCLLVLSILLSLLISKIMILSPDYHMVNQKNQLFVYSLSEVLQLKAIESWIPNFIYLLSWFVAYLTFPVLGFGMLSFILSKQFQKEKLFILLLSILPLLGLIIFGRLVNPRYILFMVVTYIPLAAFGLYEVYSSTKKKVIVSVILVLSLLPCLFTDFFILTDFSVAPIPYEDRYQLANSFAAGYGLKEIYDFIEIESKKQTVYLGLEGKYGSLPTTYAQIFLEKNLEVVRIPIDYPLPRELPQELLWAAEKHPVYVVLNIEQQAPRSWPVTLIREYQKGNSAYYLRLYQVDQRRLRLKK